MLAASERKFAQPMPPAEALRFWPFSFADAVKTKKIIAPALHVVIGAPKKVLATSYAQTHEAIQGRVRRAINSGDLGRHQVPTDRLPALIGVANVAAGPDWQQSAKRLVDILITGSRSVQ
ncbi:MAG: hypothetical protein WCC21_14610 [Candidatus Acidiferrales bacterium]